MKKFSFSLETVLRYKNQVLDSLKAEQAAMMLRVKRQEDKIEGLKQQYREANERYCERKLGGFTIIEAYEYDAYFRSMERTIEQEYEKLAEFKRQEEAKRAEMIEARKESMSIENLRAKKRESYDKQIQKIEEQFIEEFVSNSRAAEARLAAGQ